MLRQFRALNETRPSVDKSGHEDGAGSTLDADKNSRQTKLTKEAEEALVQEKYCEAMVKWANNEKMEAKTAFQELLLCPILNEVQNSPSAFVSLTPTLYAICKNLATILSEEGKHEDAVELFLKATSVDDTEALLWHKLGIQAFKSEQHSMAYYAFEKCLRVSPEFWPCMDNMISLLYIIGDFPGCLFHIEKALEQRGDYLRGLVVKDEIFRQIPYMKELTWEYFKNFDDQTYDQERAREILDKLNSYVDKLTKEPQLESMEPVNVDFDLSDFSIASLGQALYTLYGKLKDVPEFTCAIDLSRWIESAGANRSDSVEMAEDFAVALDQLKEMNAAGDLCMQRTSNEEESPDTYAENSAGDSDIEVVQILSKSEIPIPVDERTPNDAAAPSPVGKVRKGGVKRKHEGSGSPNVFKRRSTRLIPGFCMDDPEAFGPLTTKPVSLAEHLRSYAPWVFASENTADTNDEEGRDGTERGRSSSTDMEPSNDPRPPLFDDLFSKQDVLAFLEENQMRLITGLLFEYLRMVQQRGQCNFRWSDQLRTAFVDCYECWAEHSQFVIPCDDDKPELKSVLEEQCRDEGFVRMVYAECKIWNGQLADEDNQLILLRLCSYLSHLSTFSGVFKTEEERKEFRCRLDFVQASVEEAKKRYTAATFYLECCADALAGGVLQLAHCNWTISQFTLNQRMASLERAGLFDRVEDVFAQNDFQSVVDILTPSPGDTAQRETNTLNLRQFEILLSCFRNLRKPAEAALSLAKALKFGLNLYGGLEAGEKKEWWVTIGKMLAIGEWALDRQSVNAAWTAMTGNHRRDLANLLIELIGMVDECPLKKEDVPECCWLSPWLILYEMSRRLEMAALDESYASAWYEKASNATVIMATRSLMILWKCHEELGRRKLCMLREGAVLIELAEEILNTLRHPAVATTIPSACMNDTLNCAEQCFYCLYKYPAKKKRHLDEHDAQPIQLTWSRAHLLFYFVKPDQAPEFDDHPHTSAISADTAQLLHKIESMVPVMLKPEPFAKQLDKFFEAKPPKIRNFPQMALANEPIIGDLYHLLGDYYLKTQDFEKAVGYYQFDLCVSADRFDSWAGLAMARGYLLDTRLRSIELKYDLNAWTVVHREAKAALYCYERATTLRPDHYVLLVEYGSMAYQLHSFFSRSLKHVGSKQTSAAKHNLIKARWVYLGKAERALENAHSVADSPTNMEKEEWIHNYFLGKIAEKRAAAVSEGDPVVALRRYHAAAYHLHKDGARYPDKIKYSPQRYALETLEVFYRAHVCVLKWLIRKKVTMDMMRDFSKYLKLFSGSPLYGPKMTERSANTARLLCDPDVVSSVDCMLDMIDKGDDSSMNTSSSTLDSSDESMESLDDSTVSAMRGQLIQCCNEAFQLCVRRFGNHYKSYYWLAVIYFEVDEFKDCKKSRQLLLGPVNIPEFNIQNALFQHRKRSNFFEAIWRIPVDDISRAGSFPEHMYRSMVLMCKVLENLRDYQHLCELVIALHRKPSADKHKYLREPDREELVELASTSAECTLKEAGNKETEKVLVATYRVYLALYKMQCGNKSRWGELLRTILAAKSGLNINDIEFQSAFTMCQGLERKQRENIAGSRSPHKASANVPVDLSGLSTSRATLGQVRHFPKTFSAPSDVSGPLASGSSSSTPRLPARPSHPSHPIFPITVAVQRMMSSTPTQVAATATAIQRPSVTVARQSSMQHPSSSMHQRPAANPTAMHRPTVTESRHSSSQWMVSSTPTQAAVAGTRKQPATTVARQSSVQHPSSTSAHQRPSTNTTTTQRPVNNPASTQRPSTNPAATPASAQRLLTNPAATQRPLATPAVTQRQAANPAATQRPAANPAATQRPAAGPTSTQRPSTNPAAAQRPTANPAATQRPAAGPTSTQRRSTNPLATQRPAVTVSRQSSLQRVVTSTATQATRATAAGAATQRPTVTVGHQSVVQQRPTANPAATQRPVASQISRSLPSFPPDISAAFSGAFASTFDMYSASFLGSLLSQCPPYPPYTHPTTSVGTGHMSQSQRSVAAIMANALTNPVSSSSAHQPQPYTTIGSTPVTTSPRSVIQERLNWANYQQANATRPDPARNLGFNTIRPQSNRGTRLPPFRRIP